jgi:hypothetical protein
LRFLNTNFEQGEKESWQTIVNKIRVAVSKAEVNRVADNKVAAVKAVDKTQAVDKVSREAREANKAAKAKRVVRAAVRSCRIGEVSLMRLTSHCKRLR